MSVATLKLVHVGCVVVSILLFVARAGWLWATGRRWRRRWARMVPHFIDTCLLASALVLAWMTRQYPFVETWLTAKFFALLAYIAAGSLAMRPGLAPAARGAALATALALFGYIVAVALRRDPLPLPLG